MNETEAYPDCPDWTRRATREYAPGDLVVVGPAYRGNGHYAHDEFRGLYTVVGRSMDNGPDYRITRGDVRAWVAEDSEGARYDFDVWVHAARITPVRANPTTPQENDHEASN